MGENVLFELWTHYTELLRNYTNFILSIVWPLVSLGKNKINNKLK